MLRVPFDRSPPIAASPCADDALRRRARGRVRRRRVSHDRRSIAALYARDASIITGGRTRRRVLSRRPTAEVQACVRIARAPRAPVRRPRRRAPGWPVARCPCDEPGGRSSTTRMDRILEVDVDERASRGSSPGVLNLDLTRRSAPHGFHFAPDPSSQQACIDRRQRRQQLRRPALPGLRRHERPRRRGRGRAARRRGRACSAGSTPSRPGYDLRGVFVGSEGTLGIATRIAVRLTPNPPAVRTLLLDFATVADAAADGERHHRRRHRAGGDRDDGRSASRGPSRTTCTPAIPTDAAAVLLVEVDGLPGGVDGRAGDRSTDRAARHGARTVRVAADEAERALLWKGRKTAFGAIARIKPNYYLHDTVVPRTKLVEVLEPGLRDRRAPRPARDERVPRRRRQPAPAARVRRPRAGRARAGARGRRRDRRGVARRRRRAVGRARHRPREARRSCRCSSPTTTSTTRTGCAARSTPTASRTRARCCPTGAELRRRASTSTAMPGGRVGVTTTDRRTFAAEVGGATRPGRVRGRAHPVGRRRATRWRDARMVRAPVGHRRRTSRRR